MKVSKLFLYSVPVFLGLLLAVVNAHYQSAGDTQATTKDEYLRQAAELAKDKDAFVEYEALFKTIAEEEGGDYAFAVLKEAEIPFGLDTHLLGHSIGEILYKQTGINGMSLCTHDFRNACSHTMVIGALLEEGTDALPQIRTACHAAPGGKGAYTMCFHGLGHGVLAFNGYSFERTIAMCDELGSEEFNHQEAVECFGGAVMEIIGGGGHDPEIWSAQREKYLHPEDPFGICRESFVTDKYRPMCYNYMTPYVYEAVGADMSAPGGEAFVAAFAECEKIPLSEPELRNACFGGQGKEFIGLAMGRNFSGSEVPSTSQLQKMQDWCGLATSEDGYKYCSGSVINSLYWGGENTYVAALEYCSLESDDLTDECIGQMINNVQFYIDDTQYRREFCEAVPPESVTECQQSLL
jgi:hypothetical protein